MIREIRSFPIPRGHPRAGAARPGCLWQIRWLNFPDFPSVTLEIAEIDLNPVFVFSKGLVVGDVRVISAETIKENRHDHPYTSPARA